MSALDDLKTRAEATDYAETSRHADVIAFCDTLAAESKKVQRGSLGKSGEGQDLVTLVVSNKKCFSPEDATAQGKVVVMVEANIHAGEVEGKEAILALVRDLVRGDLGKVGKKILDKVCLVVGVRTALRAVPPRVAAEIWDATVGAEFRLYPGEGGSWIDFGRLENSVNSSSNTLSEGHQIVDNIVQVNQNSLSQPVRSSGGSSRSSG